MKILKIGKIFSFRKKKHIPAIPYAWKYYPYEKPEDFNSYLCYVKTKGVYGFSYMCLVYDIISDYWYGLGFDPTVDFVEAWVEFGNPPLL